MESVECRPSRGTAPSVSYSAGLLGSSLVQVSGIEGPRCPVIPSPRTVFCQPDFIFMQSGPFWLACLAIQNRWLEFPHCLLTRQARSSRKCCRRFGHNRRLSHSQLLAYDWRLHHPTQHLGIAPLHSNRSNSGLGSLADSESPCGLE